MKKVTFLLLILISSGSLVSQGFPEKAIKRELNIKTIEMDADNGAFTTVYKDGKVGIYLCAWSYGDKARQTVDCKYEDFKRVRVREDKYSNGKIYLALKKEEKWGWVNWMTGEEKSEFIYETVDDLESPRY